MLVVSYKGRAFARDQSEFASDHAPALSDEPRTHRCCRSFRDVERIRDCIVPRLTGAHWQAALFRARESNAPWPAAWLERRNVRGRQPVFEVSGRSAEWGRAAHLAALAEGPECPMGAPRAQASDFLKSCRLERSDIDAEGWRGPAAAQAHRELMRRVTTWG